MEKRVTFDRTNESVLLCILLDGTSSEKEGSEEKNTVFPLIIEPVLDKRVFDQKIVYLHWAYGK